MITGGGLDRWLCTADSSTQGSGSPCGLTLTTLSTSMATFTSIRGSTPRRVKADSSRRAPRTPPTAPTATTAERRTIWLRENRSTGWCPARWIGALCSSRSPRRFERRNWGHRNVRQQVDSSRRSTVKIETSKQKRVSVCVRVRVCATSGGRVDRVRELGRNHVEEKFP